MDSVEQKPANPDEDRPKFSKVYLLGALAILLVGVLLGSYLSLKQKAPDDSSRVSQEQGDISGSQTQAGGPLLESQSGQVAGQDVQVFPEGKPSTNIPVEPKPESIPPPALPPTPRPAPKVNVCEQAKKDMGVAQDNTQKEYAASTAAAKTAYDQEQQELSRQLTELQRQRNEAINNYLTAIAIATSKYNSATTTSAYEVYQQEQSAALQAYTQIITNISSQEVPLLDQKKNARQKYDDTLASAQTKRDQDLTAAQVRFESKTAGQNCSL